MGGEKTIEGRVTTPCNRVKVALSRCWKVKGSDAPGRRVESIAFLSAPVANSGEFCRSEAPSHCCTQGSKRINVHFVADGAASRADGWGAA